MRFCKIPLSRSAEKMAGNERVTTHRKPKNALLYSFLKAILTYNFYVQFFPPNVTYKLFTRVQNNIGPWKIKILPFGITPIGKVICSWIFNEIKSKEKERVSNEDRSWQLTKIIFIQAWKTLVVGGIVSCSSWAATLCVDAFWGIYPLAPFWCYVEP